MTGLSLAMAAPRSSMSSRAPVTRANRLPNSENSMGIMRPKTEMVVRARAARKPDDAQPRPRAPRYSAMPSATQARQIAHS